MTGMMNEFEKVIETGLKTQNEHRITANALLTGCLVYGAKFKNIIEKVKPKINNEVFEQW